MCLYCLSPIQGTREVRGAVAGPVTYEEDQGWLSSVLSIPGTHVRPQPSAVEGMRELVTEIVNN